VGLNGTVTVAAVAGVATFSNLSVSNAGTGLRLRATAAGIAGNALSNQFTITAGVATQLVITQQPVSSVLFSPIRFTLEARTATGTVATGYQGTVSVGFIQRPNGGLISSVVSSGFTNGVATVEVNVNVVGTYIFTLTASGLPEVFSAPITVSVASLSIESGSGQTGPANAQLGQLLVAKVIDGATNPAPGVTVTWSVVSGNGTLVVINAVTDAAGLASARWTLGAAGAQVAQAQIGSGPFVQFTATITP
jgi:hypothetical protein